MLQTFMDHFDSYNWFIATLKVDQKVIQHILGQDKHVSLPLPVVKDKIFNII